MSWAESTNSAGSAAAADRSARSGSQLSLRRRATSRLSPTELAAGVKAALRNRPSQQRRQVPQYRRPGRFAFADLAIDYAARSS